MDLHHITYQGPALDDPEILRDVPDSLGSILRCVERLCAVWWGSACPGRLHRP